MNARDARRVADLVNSKKSLDDPIVARIKAAAEQGFLEIHLEGKRDFDPSEAAAIESMLRSLGYNVSYSGSPHSAEIMMFVSWL